MCTHPHDDAKGSFLVPFVAFLFLWVFAHPVLFGWLCLFEEFCRKGELSIVAAAFGAFIGVFFFVWTELFVSLPSALLACVILLILLNTAKTPERLRLWGYVYCVGLFFISTFIVSAFCFIWAYGEIGSWWTPIVASAVLSFATYIFCFGVISYTYTRRLFWFLLAINIVGIVGIQLSGLADDEILFSVFCFPSFLTVVAIATYAAVYPIVTAIIRRRRKKKNDI